MTRVCHRRGNWQGAARSRHGVRGSKARSVGEGGSGAQGGRQAVVGTVFHQEAPRGRKIKSGSLGCGLLEARVNTTGRPAIPAAGPGPALRFGAERLPRRAPFRGRPWQEAGRREAPGRLGDSGRGRRVVRGSGRASGGRAQKWPGRGRDRLRRAGWGATQVGTGWAPGSWWARAWRLVVERVTSCPRHLGGRLSLVPQGARATPYQEALAVGPTTLDDLARMVLPSGQATAVMPGPRGTAGGGGGQSCTCRGRRSAGDTPHACILAAPGANRTSLERGIRRWPMERQAGRRWRRAARGSQAALCQPEHRKVARCSVPIAHSASMPRRPWSAFLHRPCEIRRPCCIVTLLPAAGEAFPSLQTAAIHGARPLAPIKENPWSPNHERHPETSEQDTMEQDSSKTSGQGERDNKGGERQRKAKKRRRDTTNLQPLACRPRPPHLEPRDPGALCRSRRPRHLGPAR